ncbi:MAG: hypothetical protein ABIN35_04045 [candidate division WOR-3 bacterium]
MKKIFLFIFLFLFSISIFSASFNLRTPNGNENYIVGNQMPIHWDITGSATSARLEYSIDGGTNWVLIYSATQNDGDYLWTVPNNPSLTCKIRISNPSDPNDFDVSDTFFVISRPEIFIKKPVQNDILIIGENYPIHWDWTGVFSNVKLEYTTDGGTNWTVITSSTPNDGEYIWSVPNFPSTQCKIRITNTTDPNSFAITENTFTIANNSLTLITPNGGEQYITGKYYPIYWLWSGSFTSVKLEYSADSGNIWNSITTSTTNDGSHNWLIPSINPSSKCLLKITNVSNPAVYDISDYPFSILSTSLTLLTPNGGETFVAGTKANISWDWEGSIANVKLEYSSDGGMNWNSITTSTACDGSYLWTVPNISTNNLLIRITNVNDVNCYDVSNSQSSIVTAQIDITYPNGGEQLIVGEKYPINWNWSGSFANVKIEYSTNNGSSWSTIDASDPNDGSFVWTVPLTPSSQCLIKISDAANSSVYDISNFSFTIKKPEIKIVKINGNDTLIASNKYPIVWQTEGTISNVNIEYSTNNGTTWNTIVTNTPNDGSYVWTVPSTPSSNYRLKITNSSDVTSYDISDTTFVVKSPQINLLSPNGGEEFKTGEKYPVLWNSNSDFASVNIDYSSDGGTTWNSIVLSETNDGSYVWNIPSNLTPSTNYRIRVRNSSDNNSFDISDNTFTISSPSIKIISPDSGVSLLSGEKVSINYTYDASFPNVKIEYSSDNGLTWNVITNSTSNTGTYIWTIPNLNSNDCFIKVLNLSDTLNSYAVSKKFSISKPTITVKSPKSNDSLLVGNVYQIVWINNGEISNVKIEYSTDNGSTWNIIVSSTVNEGSYYWTIPSTISSNVLIKVSDVSDPSNYAVSSQFSIIPAQITLVSPNGGETIIAGEYLPIEWNWIGSFSYVKLEYSTDGGSTWNKIINSDTLNDGSFIWTVPSTAVSSNVLFRVSNNQDPTNTFDVSNGVFSIVSPTISIISPNGGENLVGGEVYPIRWRSQGTFANVMIEYSTDGINWISIDPSDPNDGVFNWTVPSIVSSNVKIRITSTTDGNTQDVSDNNFSIVSPTLTILSPNGGESFVSGDILPIHWKNNGNVSNVKIEYSTNNGNTWNTIISSTTNNGYYRWTIPSLVVSDSIKFRVTSTADSLTKDVSDGLISIKRPAIKILTPNGSENLTVGEYTPIHWENDGQFLNVKIEYSTDGGTVWKTISSSETNDGNYIWKVPNDVSNNCIIRVTNTSDNLSYDISDNTFSILKPSVSVFNPDSAAVLIVGNKYPIYWNWTGTVDSVIIELYYKVSGIVQSTFISTATLNTGSFIFTVPNYVSDSCWIKVTSTANDSVYSLSKVFSIVRPIYDIVQPNGGESFYRGEKLEINWDWIGGPDSVSLFYSLDGGLNYSLIKSIKNTGSYLWSMPTYLINTYKVKVMSTRDNYAFDESDNNFSAKNPVLVINQPVSGDVIYYNNYFPVYTTQRGFLPNDSLLIQIYSAKKGTINLGTFAVNPNEIFLFKDTFSDTLDTIEVIILNKSTNDTFDISDKITVLPVDTIDTIIFPNQNDTMYVSELYYVIWNMRATDPKDKVKLNYSTDGINFFEYGTKNADTTFFPFYIPKNASSNNFIIRLDFYDSLNVFKKSLSVSNLLVKKPLLDLVYPDNTDTLYVGRTHNIIWRTVKGYVDSFQLYYNTDGITWKEIKNLVSDTFSYSWTIPNEPTSNAVIRVEKYGDNQVTAYSQSFVIKPQEIFITSPLSNDTFVSGRDYHISWYNFGGVDSVNIYYSIDGGSNWTFVAKQGNSNSYKWTVPNYSSNKALVKVEFTRNSNVFDISDTFTIIPQNLLVTYPDSSTIWYAGNKYYITWDYTGNFSNVKITYSLDNGKNWNVITNSTANSQNYLWTLPQIYSDSVIVKVANTDDTTKFDVSSMFRIIPQQITVKYPFSSESLISGKQYNITWVYKGLFDTSIVEYSTNNGVNWNTLGKTLTSNRYYIWTTPNVKSDSTLIRIVNKDNTSILGVSELFTISDKIITISSPKLNDEYIVGEKALITFDFLGSSNDSVIISYSTDGGTIWTQIDTIPSSAQYLEWTVPNVISSNCYIKITCLRLTSSTAISERFSIVPQTINVMSPLSSSEWITGRKYYITWNYTGSFSNVDLEYSTNGGSTWQTIATTTNSKYYLWTLPNISSSNSLVRVKNSSNTSVFGVSPIFTMKYPSITVVSPNLSDTLLCGKYYYITWYSNMGSGDSVVISYSKNGGITYTIIDTISATQKYFKWKVPEIGSTNCLVKITGYESPIIEGYSQQFVIKDQSINITYPNINDTIISLSPFYITWDFTGGLDTLVGEYSLDNGSNWTTFSNSIVASNQNYLFNPFPISNSLQTLIRLKNKANVLVQGVSNQIVALYPEIGITSFKPNSSFIVGSKIFITWKNNGLIDKVNIYYSIDNGTSWNLIVSSYTNSGYYEWTIPNYISDSCFVKVSYTSLESVYDVSERFSIIPQTIFLFSPSFNDSLMVSKTYPITWYNTGTVDNVMLEYSLDGGSIWNTITGSTVNNKYYEWTLPTTLSSTLNGLIRVSNVGNLNVFDLSDNFRIIPQKLEITYPTLNSQFFVSRKYIITWKTVGTISTVNLYYSLDNGANWISLASNLTNNGYYEWTVPDVNSNLVLLRITNSNNEAVYDDSEVFSIVPQLVLVNSPTSTDRWIVGRKYFITWTNIGTISKVRIEYSYNDGANWNMVVDNLSNTNSYEWAIPNTPSENCFVKVSNYDNTSVYGTSSKFSIPLQTIEVLSPKMTDEYVSGNKYFITWKYTGTISNVDIQYSKDNGATWTYVATGVSNTGYYEWIVPTEDSDNCLIKVLNSNNNNVYGISERFTILPQNIIVTSPSSSDTMIAGRKYYITWRNSGAFTNCDIFYSTDLGLQWRSIATGVSNTGYYEWTIPDIAVSDMALIKISNSSQSTIHGISDTFVISKPIVKFTSPVLGNIFETTKKYYFTWTTLGTILQYNLEISYDKGVSWIQIIANQNNSGNYEWTVPSGMYSDSCMLKLTSSSNSSIYYYSDLFSIVSYSNIDNISVLKNKTIKYFNTKLNNSVNEKILFVEIPEDCYSRIEIFDLTGRSVGKVYDGKINSGVHRFELENYLNSKGIYFIKVVSSKDDKTIYEKNVKMLNLR